MTERAGILCGVFLLSGSLYAQAPPCEDRDLDGYVAGPGCAVQEDCNDADSKVFPGAVEVCNGWDDDCDGDLDEGCERTCPDFGEARRVTIFNPASRPEIAVAERGWAVLYDHSAPGDPSAAVTRLDPHGSLLIGDRVVTTNRHSNYEIVWTGNEMVSSWDGSAGPSSDYGLYIGTLGPWGKPTREIRRLSAHDLYHYDLLWNGYEFAMLYNDRTLDSTVVLRLGPAFDAVPDESIVGSRQNFTDSFAWNGAGFGWSYDRATFTSASDVFFRPLDRTALPVDQAVQITDHSEIPGSYASRSVLVSKGPGAGYGICWGDTRNEKREIWCAILGPFGGIVTPPGEFLASFAATDVSAHSLAWNGHEFLLVWSNPGGLSPLLGRIAGTRISADGQLLEWRNITENPFDRDPEVAWNGRSWGLAIEEWLEGQSTDPAVTFVEVGCNCSTDGDGDDVFPCAGGDCDDGNDTIGAGKPELCSDGKDNDCDGLTDCNDVDCHQNGNAPTAIGGFAFGTDKVGFSWAPDPRAAQYDVARGELWDLRDMENFRWTGCLLSRYPGTTGSDPEDPAAGHGFYYVVRGTARTCLLGTWGTPERDATLTGCP